jgi:hypothetical protein
MELEQFNKYIKKPINAEDAMGACLDDSCNCNSNPKEED